MPLDEPAELYDIEIMNGAAVQRLFASLTTPTYNIGVGAFADSTLLILLNQGDYNGAADQFLVWRMVRDPKPPHALKPSDGLLIRRQLERALFLHGTYQ